MKEAALRDVLFAASEGDLGALQSQSEAGLDLFAADYDSRTAFHLAAVCCCTHTCARVRF